MQSNHVMVKGNIPLHPASSRLTLVENSSPDSPGGCERRCAIVIGNRDHFLAYQTATFEAQSWTLGSGDATFVDSSHNIELGIETVI